MGKIRSVRPTVCMCCRSRRVWKSAEGMHSAASLSWNKFPLYPYALNILSPE